MSITNSLIRSLTQLRELHRRGNGDLEAMLPKILSEIESDIARIRGLENMEILSAELLREFQVQNREYAA